MKKAKLLLPAIGALVLSSAAAVTGTVAWFTATLTANTKTDSVTVVKTGSSLSVKNAAGVGTSLDKDGTTIHHGQLVDGSVDLVTGTVKGPTFGPDGKTLTGFKTEQEYGTGQFRATTFTITFTLDMTLEQNNTTFGIYLDAPSTEGDKTSAEGTIYEGFRVGIKTDNNYMVYAPYSKTSENLDYVGESTTSAANYAKYDANHVINGEPIVSTYVASGNTMLGSVTNGTSGEVPKPTLTATVYTWFEGAVIDNDSTKTTSDISYNLYFNAVKKVA